MATTEPGTSLVQRTQQVVENLRHPEFLEQVRETLPENVSLDRFVRVAITAIRSNPDLAAADQTSLFGSIVKCAQDGLYPDGREAALVIYSGKVSYLPMIGGYRKIAGDHGWAITTQHVRAGDEFDYEEGLEPKLTHRRARPDGRGELVNAYAIAQHRDGRKLFVVLDEDEIEKCRQVSRAKDNGPWKTWTERMWEKTAGKRLFKQLPISDRDLVDRVLAADLIPDGADPAELLYGPGSNGHHDLPAAEPPADPPQDGTAYSRDSQQAPAVAPPTAAAGVPGPIEEGVFEPLDDEASAEEFALAAATTVSRGQWAGKTFSEIADAGDEGATWLFVQMKRLDPAGNGRALAVFLQGRLPEVWQRYETWKAEQ